MSGNFDIPLDLKCSEILKEYYSGANEIIKAALEERKKIKFLIRICDNNRTYAALIDHLRNWLPQKNHLIGKPD